MFTDRLRSVVRTGWHNRPEPRWLVVTTIGGHLLVVAVAVWIALTRGADIPAPLRQPLLVGLVVVIATSTLLLARNARQAAQLRDSARARRREAEEAFTILEAMSENTPAVFLMVGNNNVVRHANRMAERLGGRPLVGTRCRDVAFGLHDERCQSCPWRTLEGEQACTGAPASGDTDDHVAFSHHVLEMHDGSRRLVLVGRVLTEQKRLQEQLFHRERLATLGLLTAGVVHDLGNPLAALLATAQRLQHEPLSEPGHAAVDGMREDLARLARTLRELVDFSRRRRDDLRLVSVGAIVEDVLRILRHDPRMRRVEVKLALDPETPSVQAIEDHLVQVLLNLLINALDAMPDGGTIALSVGAKDGAVQVSITDSGVGMAPEVLAHAFEPLFTTKPPGRGAGLGLSICREVLSAHGGEVDLVSRPGVGTTAIVRLPAWISGNTGAHPQPLPADAKTADAKTTAAAPVAAP